MTLPAEQSLQKLQFYVTTPYPCGYLPKKLAQSLIASPQHLINSKVYSGLIAQGFRRSGKFAYRPHCETCRACIAVRVVLDEFTPNRSQKRAFKQHANLQVRILPLHFNLAHFNLYQLYQATRHGDNQDLSQSKDEAEQYRQFLCQSNVESLMIEFRDAKDQVKIVSVVDIVHDGVSAVYTFYDTAQDANMPKTSFGTYSIMWQIEWTKSLHLPFLYLGYWIENSPKMAYKQHFKPQQKLIDGEWF
jgi:leucyl-tRNA---protein transferase